MFLILFVLTATRAIAFDSAQGPFGPPDFYSYSTEHKYTGAAKEPTVHMEEQKLAFRIPLYRNSLTSPTTGISFIGSSQRTALSDNLTFSDRGNSISKEFYSTQAGLFASTLADNNYRYSATATFGKAGETFWTDGGADSNIITATAQLERPLSNGNSWHYFLSYSSARTTFPGIPIPGFAYSMRGDSHTLVLGLPFTFWFYRDGVMSYTTLLSPFTASAEVAARVWGPLQLYSNLAWLPRAYQNLVPNSKDRLLLDGKEFGAGLRLTSRDRKSSLIVGYVNAFDRSFKLGESRRKPNSSSISIADAGGYQIKVSASF